MNEWIEIAHTGSADETKAVAAALAQLVGPGAVVTLDGDLGAGKTQFTQGFAAALGIEDSVTSPTFTVMIEYSQGRLPLYHFDLYRLEDAAELDDIAFWEYAEGEGVSVVEWATKFADDMPDSRIEVRIDRGTSEDDRTVFARGIGTDAAAVVAEWKKA